MAVLLIDPISSGAAYIDKLAAVKAEFTVGFTAMPDVFAAQAETIRATHPELRFLDLSRNLEANLSGRGFNYVVCAGETGTAAADRARELLEIEPRNVGPTAPRVDKYEAQTALRDAGMRHIVSYPVRSVADLNGVNVGWPAVVKPVNSAGTDGVRIVADDVALARSITEQLGARNALGRMNSHVVVQEFVPGIEYVVDGCALGDRWTVASVCRYEKELIGDVPVYRELIWLEPDEVPEADGLMAYLGGVLQVLGIRIGSFHAELFRHSGDWMLIEIGLRPHGGGHPAFTEALTGSSQVAVEVGYALGNPPTSDSHWPALRRRGAVVFFSVEDEVVFDSTPGPRLAGLPGLLHGSVAAVQGQRARPPRSLFDTFDLGFVVVTASTRAGLEERATIARTEFAATHSPAVRTSKP